MKNVRKVVSRFLWILLLFQCSRKCEPKIFINSNERIVIIHNDSIFIERNYNFPLKKNPYSITVESDLFSCHREGEFYNIKLNIMYSGENLGLTSPDTCASMSYLLNSPLFIVRFNNLKWDSIQVIYDYSPNKNVSIFNTKSYCLRAFPLTLDQEVELFFDDKYSWTNSRTISFEIPIFKLFYRGKVIKEKDPLYVNSIFSNLKTHAFSKFHDLE